MGYALGPVLSVGGEKEYQNAMKAVRESMKYVQAEAAAATSAFGKNDTSIKALTTRHGELKKALGVQKDAVKAAEDALQRMTKDGIDPSSQAYKRMEANLNNAKATLNTTKGEIADNEQAIKGLNKEANDKAAEKFADGWKNVGKVIGGVLKTGLKVAAISAAAIGTAAAVAAKKIWDVGKETGNWADELITLSNQTGVSVQSLQELQYAAKFVDVEVETMAHGLARTTMAISSASKAGEDYISTSNGINIALKDANGGLKSSQDVFYEAVDAIGALANETDREVAAQQLFGKSYQDLMPLINAGTESLKAYAEEARGAGLILSDEMVKQLGSFDDAMERTEAQMSGIGRQLAVIFLPALQSVGTGISEFLSKISTTLADGFQQSDIKVIGEYISEKLISGLQTISKYLPAFIETVTAMLTEVVDVIVAVLPEVLPTLLDGAMQLLTGLIEAIIENVQPLADMISSMAVKLVEFIIQSLPLLLEGAIQIVLAIAQGITDNLPTLIPAIVAGILVMVQALVDNLPLIIDAGIDILLALIEGIIKSIPEIIKAMPQIIKSIVEALISNIGEIVKCGVTLLLALIENLPTIIIELVKATPQIIKAIAEGILQGVSRLGEVGNDLIKGLWNGIKDSATWLWNKVKGWCDDLVGKIKGFFGIKSPSKLFAGFGENMALGLGVGFGDEMKTVAQQMIDAVPTSFSVNGAYGVGGAYGHGGVVVNMSNNFTGYKTRDGVAAARDLNRQLGMAY